MRYCRKYQRILSSKDISLHKCYYVKKGHRKGSWCKLMVKM